MSTQLDWIGSGGERAGRVSAPGHAPPLPCPRARNTDPVSSHHAADRADKFAAGQAGRVLAALRRYPQSTSAELAMSAGMDRYAVARRLPELAEAGLARRHDPPADFLARWIPCAVSGKAVCRWVAVEHSR